MGNFLKKMFHEDFKILFVALTLCSESACQHPDVSPRADI